MVVFLNIFEFLFSTIAIFFTWILIMNIITSTINPQIIVEDGNIVETPTQKPIEFKKQK